MQAVKRRLFFYIYLSLSFFFCYNGLASEELEDAKEILNVSFILSCDAGLVALEGMGEGVRKYQL